MRERQREGKIRKRYEREVWGKKLTWTYHRRDCKGRNIGKERERRGWESKRGREREREMRYIGRR